MQGLGMMSDLGSQIANMRNQAQNRQLQASGMLQGMGQSYLDAPQQYAQNLMGMGSQMQGQQQQAYDRQSQEFLRMAAENNPWISQLFGLAGLQSNMTPQQYQPSGLSQLLGGLMGGAGIAGGLGWSPFG